MEEVWLNPKKLHKLTFFVSYILTCGIYKHMDQIHMLQLISFINFEYKSICQYYPQLDLLLTRTLRLLKWRSSRAL